MDAHTFIQKWQSSQLKERSGSQSHFVDLCHLLGVQTPTEADPDGSWYTFEKGVDKAGGGKGFADVWKRRCFGWEYKGKHKDLDAAYAQLLRYKDSLENPPLLIVSDMDTIIIHSNFTNTAKVTTRVALEDLRDSQMQMRLRAIFSEAEVQAFKPGVTVEQITREVADQFSRLAQTLRGRGHDPQAVAHFLSKLLFCLFAEDVGLLPLNLFTKLLESSHTDPARFGQRLAALFRAMCAGGDFGEHVIPWFNGGLFDDDHVVPLDAADLITLKAAASKDWSQVEPSIFGTLFERGLDPNKRSQLGAHYTPRSDIERVVDPVMTDHLRREWDLARAAADALLEKARAAEAEIQAIRAAAQAMTTGTKAEDEKLQKRIKALKGQATKARKEARGRVDEYLNAWVRRVRVLDPACGSGNFLFVALERLHDLEKACLLYRSQTLPDAEAGVQLSADIQVGPHQVLGIEINPYAHELAQVTVWIGHLQWMLNNGFSFERHPVLRKLDHIQCRDAVLDLSDPAQPKRATWPEADYIVGNPPFLGGTKMREELGESYVISIRKVYGKEIPGASDLVCYWFDQAQNMVSNKPTVSVGFVCTNSIRGGKNRVVLDFIFRDLKIFNAWSDEPWISEGASVRVSIICFSGFSNLSKTYLNGQEVNKIFSDLTSRFIGSKIENINFSESLPLAENKKVIFQGDSKKGKFEVEGSIAREWLLLPENPNGKRNSNVLKPWRNARDITNRPSDYWIIDFGTDMTESEAAFYEAPFKHVVKYVKPSRGKPTGEVYQISYWLHGRPRPELREALRGLKRYIATPLHSKYRQFVWFDCRILPDAANAVVAKDDDTTMGILSSKFHELWSLRIGIGNSLGVGNDPRYTPTTCFQTFPFPEGLTPNLPASQYADDPRAIAIAEAARKLNELRENWLNPADLVVRVPEVVPGYPDRLLPKDDAAAQILKKRTLTNLYNERPAWLDTLHRQLDEAVAMAYGWDPAILDDEESILARLFALNQARGASC